MAELKKLPSPKHLIKQLEKAIEKEDLDTIASLSQVKAVQEWVINDGPKKLGNSNFLLYRIVNKYKATSPSAILTMLDNGFDPKMVVTGHSSSDDYNKVVYSNGSTILHAVFRALSYSHHEPYAKNNFIEKLIERGVPIDQKNSSGYTPLCELSTVSSVFPSIVSFLVDQGADLDYTIRFLKKKGHPAHLSRMEQLKKNRLDADQKNTLENRVAELEGKVSSLEAVLIKPPEWQCQSQEKLVRHNNFFEESGGIIHDFDFKTETVSKTNLFVVNGQMMTSEAKPIAFNQFLDTGLLQKAKTFLKKNSGITPKNV